jgi:rod shape-determining protein MreC
VSSELGSRVSKERVALVMIPLLLLHLALLSLQIEGPSGTLLFKTWTLAAQTPFIAVSSWITDGIGNIWHGYIWMVGARSENEQLRETVRQLSLMNGAYEQIRQENIRLRRLVSLNDRMAFRTVGARIVARAPLFLSNIIYINRGSADGVRIDAPVISGDGIIGRVILLTRYQSQVQLITNPDASLGAMLERTRTPGVLKGSGEMLLNLDYIGNTEQIQLGDMVVSSGLDGVFPKGLMIGKIVKSEKGKSVFRSIKVAPIMDLLHLEEVSVLLSETKPEADPKPQQ